jgi:acetolactate synthase-1/2/3 large subunit
MGDGGFLMNSQELETARRLAVKFTVLVFSDNDYGLISWKQRLSRDRAVGTAIGNPDFKAYAESFGIRGYRPETVSELRDVLRKVIAGEELSVVEIPVDTEVNTELLLKLKKHESLPHDAQSQVL